MGSPRPSPVPPALPPAAPRLDLRPLALSLVRPWYNALLTLLSLAVLVTVAVVGGGWAVRWARWEVVGANLRLFLVGTYPVDQLWRVWTCVGLVAGAGAASPWLWHRPKGRLAVAGLWVAVAVGTVALLGAVRTGLWGGLLVTLLLALGGMVLSLPLGVLLALGRRSRLAVVRLACMAYIELVRGVPLVSILFMAQILMPLFLPDLRPDKLLRALVGMTAFAAAYLAETVRGGLQGVPRGQVEAAHALGLTGAQTLRLVVLPQAVRAVLPAIAGQFISLFKDTSLVAIMGILDLLGIARSVIAHPRWLGRQAEVYLFAAAVYWLFTYTISTASRRLERPETVARA